MSNSRNEKQAAEAALKAALVVLLALITLAFKTWKEADPLGAHLKKFIKDNEKKIAVAAVGSGAAGGTVAAVLIWQASLGFWGGVGAWFGLVSLPLWAPVAGGLAGAAVVAALVAGATGKLRGAAADRAAKLQAPVISVMAFTCLDADAARKALQALHDVLVGSGADKKALKRLLIDAPARTPDELNVDAEAHTLEDRRMVLQHAWDVAVSHNRVDAAARETHDRLCRLLGLGAAAEQIRGAAEAGAKARSAKVGAVVDATRALVADDAAPSLEDFLRPIVEMDPLAMAGERRQVTMRRALGLAAAAAAITALGLGQPELLGVVASAYSTARAVLETEGPVPAEKVKDLFGRTAELAKGLGIGRDRVTEITEPIDEQISKVGEKARKPSGKKS